MPLKPLSLPIGPLTALDSWEKEYAYGDQLPGDEGTVSDEAGLGTASSDVFLYAACGGELSVGAPTSTAVSVDELPDPPDPESLPDVAQLCLIMNPVAHAVTNFAGVAVAPAAIPTELGAFLYFNVDVPSLRDDLRDLLRWSTLPPGDENIEDDELARRMSLFLTGSLSVYVETGQRLGRPAPHPDDDPLHPLHLGLAACLTTGLWNPGDIFSRYRPLVDADGAAIDQFLTLVPPPPTPFSDAASKDEAIARTAARTFPYTDLQSLQRDRLLTRAEWRQVGDNQKALYLERLRARHGFTSAVESFEFNSNDSQNLFQLEAVVEFFVNFPDPWAPGERPVDLAADNSPIDHATLVLAGNNASKSGNLIQLDGNPDLSNVKAFRHRLYLAASTGEHWYTIISVDPGAHKVEAVDSNGQHPTLVPATSKWQIDVYQPIDFVPLAGEAASITGRTVTLDGSADLSRVRTSISYLPNLLCDGIVFASAPDQLVRIEDVDQESHTVKLAEDPPAAAGTTSAWRIDPVLTLVQIDPFGPREGLSGQSATASGSTVTLGDPPPKLDWLIGGGFDTIYLPGDTNAARPGKTYRILAFDPPNHTVTVDGTPTFAAGTSAWGIPAGVGGTLPQRNYSFGKSRDPRQPFDHFDGAMFLLDNGEVQPSVFRFSSYTARITTGDNRRSVLGNHRYNLTSFASSIDVGEKRSGKTWRNYTFRINDRYGALNVFKARSYFDSPVTIGGQRGIQLHNGCNDPAGSEGNGSMGCNVSPDFSKLRQKIIECFQRRGLLRHGPPGVPDPRLELLRKADTYPASSTLWKLSFPDPAKPPPQPADPATTVPADAWNDVAFLHYWLIRPSERPVG